MLQHQHPRGQYADFQLLFKQEYPIVVRHIMRIVKTQAIAEDIAQDVFMQLYNEAWQEIEHISAWLYKAALYATYNYIRADKRERDRLLKVEQEETVPSVEQSWLRTEEQEMVRDCLAELPERDRAILLMKFSGYSYDEIAATLTIEKTSVGQFLSRAKQKFRKLYQSVRGNER